MTPTDVIPGSPPPNWYPDPQDPSALRWWNGETWTDHRVPAWGPPTAPPANTGLEYVVPVNTDGWSIASGYLGILSIIPNPVTSTAAIACGIIALRAIKRSGKHGKGRAVVGLVFGVISLGLFTVVMLAAAIDSA